MDRSPIRAGVIGYPVGHSLSPLLHRIWAAREGIEIEYEPVEVAPGYDAFASAARTLAAQGWRGANVTLPHKENALRFALETGHASDTAIEAGAANMLTFGETLYADNSDVEGFAAPLRNLLRPDDRRGRAVLLGAGGAARAIAVALKRLGYERIEIANRSAGRAQALAEAFGGDVVAWEGREAALAGADLLVNATSLGMSGKPALTLPLERLPARAIVCEIVYSPLETALLKEARARGLRTTDGLSMLMGQAVLAYRAWFGATAEADEDLRARLTAALAARGQA
ncbi:MAG: shikimate dehydrogenase [Alphaproteobacteria bacterium]|nr:shikimate dehydrogenase [Alphaproteobacteria bacterium]